MVHGNSLSNSVEGRRWDLGPLLITIETLSPIYELKDFFVLISIEFIVMVLILIIYVVNERIF
jgi:hypothetical protein